MRVLRGKQRLGSRGRGILILQAELDGLDGTVPQGHAACWIVCALSPVPHSIPLRPIPCSVDVPGPIHAVSLADAIDGVDEPLVIEVVLGLDKTAEFFQQFGIVTSERTDKLLLNL